PPAFVHSSAPLMLTNPLPLHAFWPLHEFCALAQAPWPLQALTPLQCTSPPALSAARATTAPLSSRLASPLALGMPFRHPFSVPPSSVWRLEQAARPPSATRDQAIDAVATRARKDEPDENDDVQSLR